MLVQQQRHLLGHPGQHCVVEERQRDSRSHHRIPCSQFGTSDSLRYSVSQQENYHSRTLDVRSRDGRYCTSNEEESSESCVNIIAFDRWERGLKASLKILNSAPLAMRSVITGAVGKNNKDARSVESWNTTSLLLSTGKLNLVGEF